LLEGYVHPDFWPVARSLRRQIPRRRPGGAAVCVYHRGEVVVDVWAGTRDAQGNPWQRDTLALSYSTTKGVLSTLLHIQVDRGLLDYDDPVAKHWPGFAQAGKQDLRVRQLLCHEAGLYDIRSLIDHARRITDWRHMVQALERARPLHEPGEGPAYHGLTFGWLVGELVQRVGGQPLQELLARQIAEPLGLDGLYIGLPRSELSRRAMMLGGEGAEPSGAARGRRRVGRLDRGLRATRIPLDLSPLEAALLPVGMDEIDFNSEPFVTAVIPAANGMFTARSLARMYAALAAGGELDGVRLLSRETLARATEVQNRGLGRVIPFPMHWRLGYHRVHALRASMPQAFGHFGFGGSGAWADPDRELSLALVLNSGVGTSLGDTRILRITAAAVGAADRR